MMTYFLDGHNYLNAVERYADFIDRDHAGSQQRLVKDLAAYASSRQVAIHVVFDGEPHGIVPRGGGGVTIYFSGAEEEADERILQLLRQERGRPLHVVTADRGLARRVAGSGARIIAPEEFDRLVRGRTITSRPTHPAPEKPPLPTRREVQQWKQTFADELLRRRNAGKESP